MTSNQFNQTNMLNGLHPEIFEKFAGKIQLNQKYHPKMNGSFVHTQTRMSHTPNCHTKAKEYLLLNGPSQPKPPSFFEQAYKGKEDPRKTMPL